MKVAVVHEWLVTWAGSERVLAEIMGLFPGADLFVLFDRLPPDQRRQLPRNPAGQSFLQHVPFVEKIYRNLLPLMPSAIESLNLKSYDLVLSSSHAVAKGILPHPGQLHLCYCHTPPRYLWDMTEAYFSRSFPGTVKKAAASLFLTPLRQWDYIAGQRPDAFMANSGFVARRISKIYRRRSTVIHPPVDVQRFIPKTRPGGEFFVTLGRLVPYKKIDRIVSAFAGSPHKLCVVGDPGKRRPEPRTICFSVQNEGKFLPPFSRAHAGRFSGKAFRTGDRGFAQEKRRAFQNNPSHLIPFYYGGPTVGEDN